jgi:hypothetical protein
MMVLAFIVLLVLGTSDAQGAACCGGGFAFPALILGDDTHQITTSYSYGKISDDVLETGKWLKRSDDNLSQTLKIDGAMLIAEHWQVGASIPVTERQQSGERSTGLGDISLNLGHETFPELSYSEWKPKGVSFLQLTLPTSPSIYDFSNQQAVDSRGRGFYSLGAGFALIKSWVKFDANLQTEVHHSFARDFKNAQGHNLTVTPGWGGSVTAGAGWNKGDYRLGSSVGVVTEETIRAESSAGSSLGSAQRYYPFSVQGSYMINMESALTVSYIDQSLLGDPNNASLSRSFNLSYQKRWPR